MPKGLKRTFREHGKHDQSTHGARRGVGILRRASKAARSAVGLGDKGLGTKSRFKQTHNVAKVFQKAATGKRGKKPKITWDNDGITVGVKGGKKQKSLLRKMGFKSEGGSSWSKGGQTAFNYGAGIFFGYPSGGRGSTKPGVLRRLLGGK